jgi:hypothetical protein
VQASRSGGDIEAPRALSFVIKSGYKEVLIDSAEAFEEQFHDRVGNVNLDKVMRCEDFLAYKFVMDTDEWDYSDGVFGIFSTDLARVCNLLLSGKSKCVLRSVHFLSSDPLRGQFLDDTMATVKYALLKSPLCPLEELYLMRTEVYPFGHAPHLKLVEYEPWDEEEEVLGDLWKRQASEDFQSSKSFVAGHAKFLASWEA